MNNRSWHILCWNIRGLNDSKKWEEVRNKVEESACAVFCLQETKKTEFDSAFISNIAPRRFDKYDFVPSVGASGGILLVWNSSVFSGQIIDKQHYGITASFISNQNSQVWKLTAVYGPCVEPSRSEFITWFRRHRIEEEDNWLFIGDFNFYRLLENRNRPGGNIHDTFIFNDAMGHLGLVD
jgi:exonuclease III